MKRGKRLMKAAGLALVLFVVLSLVSAFRKSKEAAKDAAGTLLVGSALAAGAAWLARAALLRVGLVAIAPVAAIGVGVAALVFSGAWALGKAELGLGGSGGGSGSGGADCPSGLRYQDADGVWRCHG